MAPLMATYNVDGAQERTRELVDRALSGEKITIATETGNVVMVSEEDWDSLVDVLSVMMLPEVRDRVKVRLAGITGEA